VPCFLRVGFPVETEAERVACVVHAEAYYYGGSESDRQRADERLREALVGADMPGWKARIYYGAARLVGGPGWRVTGVPWAFVGEYFRYSTWPAVLEDAR